MLCFVALVAVVGLCAFALGIGRFVRRRGALRSLRVDATVLSPFPPNSRALAFFEVLQAAALAESPRGRVCVGQQLVLATARAAELGGHFALRRFRLELGLLARSAQGGSSALQSLFEAERRGRRFAPPPGRPIELMIVALVPGLLFHEEPAQAASATRALLAELGLDPELLDAAAVTAAALARALALRGTPLESRRAWLDAVLCDADVSSVRAALWLRCADLAAAPVLTLRTELPPPRTAEAALAWLLSLGLRPSCEAADFARRRLPPVVLALAAALRQARRENGDAPTHERHALESHQALLLHAHKLAHYRE